MLKGAREVVLRLVQGIQGLVGECSGPERAALRRFSVFAYFDVQAFRFLACIHIGPFYSSALVLQQISTSCAVHVVRGAWTVKVTDIYPSFSTQNFT